MYFSKFCQHLGAKKVSIEEIDLRTREGRWTSNVEGKRLGIGAQATVGNELLEKFRTQMNLQDEFEGGPPDIDAAERLLRRRGLWADPSMRTLLEMRCDTANPLVERRLVLSLSSETQNNLNVVGRLKIPAFVKLSSGYDRVVSEQCEYTQTALVQF